MEMYRACKPRADKKNDLGFWYVIEEKLYDWVWITGSTSLGCAFANEVRQGSAAAFCSRSCLGLPCPGWWDTYSLRPSDTLVTECPQGLDNTKSMFNKLWQGLIQEGDMVTLVPKIQPEGETQMISIEVWLPLPDYGRV